MNEENSDERIIATERTRDPNISTEIQSKGSARRPSDTLDRTDEGNRGHRAKDGSGIVEGSGASAGVGGNSEDYDSDSAGGGEAK
jgi:hypothetical protein